MQWAESLAVPLEAQLGRAFPRCNEFGELFYLRWGSINFRVFWGTDVNIKVILKVYRDDGVCEHFLVDTDPWEIAWNSHIRVTRDFFLHPFPRTLARVSCVKFCFIAHRWGCSLPSEQDYIFMNRCAFNDAGFQHRMVTGQWSTPNRYRTHEADAAQLQRDVDWYNTHFESLNVTPKFTKGQPGHPFHPRRYIHDRIDQVIAAKEQTPGRLHTIKVCVDCIDDTDFITHLLHAAGCGVLVQCIVDWRKMSLTNSDNYARLKRSGIELLGVFCSTRDSRAEVSPDMHLKYIIFDDADCILGSFNITFDRWGSNWESGLTFHSQGICRMLDNIFQSVRGGVIQGYCIDPMSRFNLLYTFGCHYTRDRKCFRPQHAIVSEIHRARHSIRLCLFLIHDMRSEYQDSVVDALIQARCRGVDVQIVLNGHMAHTGDPGSRCSMFDELRKPLLPAVDRLRVSDIPVTLVYGVHDRDVPYCPLHSKYAVIDDAIVLEGSLNWYNTSLLSHDLLVVAAQRELSSAYSHEFHQIQRLFRCYH